MRLLVINGPNLDRLGVREPDIYGPMTLPELEEKILAWGKRLGVDIDLVQSNSESELIHAVHRSKHDGIVINPGALTHTSRALADALAGVAAPAVEVHLSNVKRREPWRRTSVLEGIVVRSIYGRGPIGYRDALRHHVNRALIPPETIGYGPHPDNVGELRRRGDRLVVLVHGGFWRSEWALDTMDSLAVDLARRGLTTWNIEYRRIDEGGGWPASGHDVLTALEFVPRLGVDADRTTVIGHSAGGHLAIWAGSRAHPPVDGVIGLAPIVYLEMHASSGMFGAEEALRLLDAGAPDSTVPTGVPVTVFHGPNDELVPVQQSRSAAERGWVDLVEPALSHFELLDPTEDHWEAVVAAIT